MPINFTVQVKKYVLLHTTCIKCHTNSVYITVTKNACTYSSFLTQTTLNGGQTVTLIWCHVSVGLFYYMPGIKHRNSECKYVSLWNASMSYTSYAQALKCPGPSFSGPAFSGLAIFLVRHFQVLYFATNLVRHFQVLHFQRLLCKLRLRGRPIDRITRFTRPSVCPSVPLSCTGS